ncbi:alpha-ribazole phosphatase [Caldimonas brevitalea]|uniref:Alpha-ribazole phosphatase n=1 Tax=Caldimonas brevitalea TaxID=413882 RepID=A0A0G3BKM0_9BURK|nr:alpha-ribazole phosphatase [Caldimonas brevitalea]
MIWRHPRPRGAAGRCIGSTDLPVDPRKAKRLAHRVRAAARRHGWARRIWTSRLQRAAAVGAWLRRWGWQHCRDARLAELDFAAWDGRSWSGIGADEVQAWCDRFADHTPGGGESLRQLFGRCEAFLREHGDATPLLIVGHAGWINTLAFMSAGRPVPERASDWPAPPGYGALRRFRWAAASSG